MTAIRIIAFLVRHALSAWTTIIFAPLLLAWCAPESDAIDTYKLGVIGLFFAVPVVIFPAILLGEWYRRSRRKSRLLSLLASALIVTVLACLLVAATAIINRENALYAAVAAGFFIFVVVFYWTATNALAIGIEAALSRFKRWRNGEDMPEQAGAAYPPQGVGSADP